MVLLYCLPRTTENVWLSIQLYLYHPPLSYHAREQKCAKSQQFAAENGLPILKNVLLPKTRGFHACVEILRGSLDAGGEVSATVFTLQNSCSYTVWPGTLSGNDGPVLGEGGFSLLPGASVQFPAMPGWSGRFWARTGCTFDEFGNGNCVTGDCGSTLKCNGGGAPPVSLAEFTIAGGISNSDKDFYDVSLVDGYNVGIGIKPTGGAGDCLYAGCIADLNINCPAELRVLDSSGVVVACKSACDAFKVSEFCCTEEHATPATCAPTQFSVMFKAACPSAYSYAYDDASSTFTCSGSDYLITFCPTGF